MTLECFLERLIRILLFPLKLLWFLFVTGLIIGAFVLWWGFLFGSVVAVVLVLIFAPDLLFLPLEIAILYVPLFSTEKESKCIESNPYIVKKEYYER